MSPDDLLRLTERLGARLQADAAALRSGAAPEHAEETGQLAAAYRLAFERVTADAAALARLSPTDRQRLMAATEALVEALNGHAQSLNALRDLSEGLTQALVDEIARQRRAGQRYGGAGEAKADQQAAPIALDRSA